MSTDGAVRRVKRAVSDVSSGRVFTVVIGLLLIVGGVAMSIGGVVDAVDSGPPDVSCGDSDGIRKQSIGMGGVSSLQQTSGENATIVVGVSDGGNGEVVALDAGNGSEKWSVDTDKYTSSSPTVAGGTVYVGAGSADGESDGTVYAIDLETGDVDWRYNVSDSGFFSSPAVAGGYVYMGLQSGDGVIALNATNGSLAWEKNHYSFSRILDSPSLKDGIVYVAGAGNDGGVVGYNATTGDEEFYYRTNDGSFNAISTVWDGVLYVNDGDETNLTAVDVDTGSELWTIDEDKVGFGMYLTAPPVVEEDSFYFTTEQAMFKANTNGSITWRFYDPGGVGNRTLAGGVTTTDGYAIAGTEAHNTGDQYETYVYAVNKSGGGFAWNYTIDGGGNTDIGSTPTADSETVYVTTQEDGVLVALDTSNGEERWNKTIGATVSSPTIVSPGSQGYSDGSRIEEQTLGMHGGLPPCEGLWIDTRPYLDHNTTVGITVYAWDSTNETWVNVTDDDELNVSVDDQSLATISGNKISSTKDETVNDVTNISASYLHISDSKRLVVANETVENVDILPPVNKFSAVLNDDNSVVVLIATGVGAGVAWLATSLAGIGGFTLVIIAGWLGGYSETHTLIAGLLIALFVGLNVSQLVEFNGR